MASRVIRTGLCGALLVAAAASCSTSKKKVASPSTTATTSSTLPASTTAPGPSASTDPVALALNTSLLTPAEVQRALSLPSQPSMETPGATATAQGPLTETGLLSVLPGSAVYKPVFERAGGSVGANATYHSGKLDIDVAAIKFSSPTGAQGFMEQVISLATVLARGQARPHPELDAGVLPTRDRVVVRVPPSPIADADKETVATALVYSNGVFFLASLIAPPGSITDQQVIDLAKAQDAKWRAARAQLGIG
jgi:hypothetical protein